MFQLTFFSLNSKKSQDIFGAKIQTDKCAVAVMDDNPYHLKTFSPNFFMKMTHHFFFEASEASEASYIFVHNFELLDDKNWLSEVKMCFGAMDRMIIIILSNICYQRSKDKKCRI